MTTNSQEPVNELDKILFNLARAGFSSGFPLDPSTDDDWYSSDEEDVDEAKAAIQAYITKELREVIGEDETKYIGTSLENETFGRNDLRAEQRQRAKAKGYDVM